MQEYTELADIGIADQQPPLELGMQELEAMDAPGWYTRGAFIGMVVSVGAVTAVMT